MKLRKTAQLSCAPLNDKYYCEYIGVNENSLHQFLIQTILGQVLWEVKSLTDQKYPI